MKKKILFVNDEMTMGGVARILNTLLKYMDREKYDIDLLVLHYRGELLSEIPSDINVINGSKFFNTIDIPLSQNKGSSIFSKLRLLFYMKTKMIKKKIQKERKQLLNKHYDIEFSAKEGFCTIFTAFGDSDKKINWIQVDYKKSNYSKNHMSLVKDALAKININIACSEVVKDSFKDVFGVNNICVINNLVDEERIRKMSFELPKGTYSKDKINLITVARFHPQKAVDRLIRIYPQIKDRYTLTIIGDGEQKQELYDLASSLGVYDDIHWLGLMPNPYPDVRAADLFVMSSIYEGYPTMTIESLISDTPILTTKVAGVDEQITREEYGWIVENTEEALLNKLQEIKNKKLLTTYKEKLLNYHYDNQKIMKEYYLIFNDKEN